jgi:hypothetical protein
MIRSALLFCAAIIVAACFACMPAPQPPQPMVGATVRGLSCTSTDFAAKVFYAASFAPSPGYPAPSPTYEVPNGSPDYRGDLKAAFDAASPDFAQQLCNLDRVYILAKDCGTGGCVGDSWGWLQSKNQVGKGRIVGLAAGLWNEATYSQYETDLAQNLLPQGATQVTYKASCSPAGVCAPGDNVTTLLVAALAHEIGHIGWYILTPLPKPSNFCGNKFFDESWSIATPPPANKNFYPFRNFLNTSERARLRNWKLWLDKHLQPPQIDVIDRPSSNQYQAIYNLFTPDQQGQPGQPWASLFAAMSPDEDFVETYKLKVLTTMSRNPLTHGSVTVQGYPPEDIVSDYLTGRKAILKTKTDCTPVVLFD